MQGAAIQQPKLPTSAVMNMSAGSGDMAAATAKLHLCRVGTVEGEKISSQSHV